MGYLKVRCVGCVPLYQSPSSIGCHVSAYACARASVCCGNKAIVVMHLRGNDTI